MFVGSIKQDNVFGCMQKTITWGKYKNKTIQVTSYTNKGEETFKTYKIWDHLSARIINKIKKNGKFVRIA